LMPRQNIRINERSSSPIAFKFKRGCDPDRTKAR
jgi:hypothetical protein